ncbi:TPA: hypothetical protein EYP44_05710, partial [Candidatus Bathyarchaeota archaeon]|nr:hypothetical protein [Candidatus Bathyarchaeota archaeon]
MISKAVIPAAGLGTRLLPATKEQPKEMLPIFTRGPGGSIRIKPLLQLVFEQLFDAGFGSFCFITGKTKRAIEDHFTVDNNYITMLRNRGKHALADDLKMFYDRLEKASVMWINQPEPRGFGHAVYYARSFVGDEEFLVHAGDTYIVSEGNDHLRRLLSTHRDLGGEVTLIVQRVDDPRMYGVIKGERIGEGRYRVKEAIEKPEVPPTRLAIMPVYVFKPTIFEALGRVPPGKGGEI